ncbi:hypothetical protein BHE74_00022915 [Ensete ventricosum]|nr:hypothetical protein BHE74_00022915 [Ensete ventricosum]
MTASTLSLLPISTKIASSLLPPSNPRAVRLSRSLLAGSISLASSSLFPRPSLRSAAVVSSLPTAWSSMSIRAFGMAELEARKLKYPTTGTEALLMGILVEGEDGEITTAHMLLGIWSEKESAGYKILASLGFDDQKAGELAKSANKDVAMNSP